MNKEELSNALQEAFAPPKSKSALTGLAVVCVICVSAGWALHNFYWRSNDFDYAVARAIDISAQCKGISYDDQWRRIEARTGRSRSLLRLDDKLVALDYLFDRISLEKCLATSPH